MKSVKFSGDYPKLHGQKTAELIAVRDVRIDKNTPQELLDYDTIKSDGTAYKLKTGDYIQLIFVGDLGIPFCTIRTNRTKWGGVKADYYSKLIGETFNVEIMSNGEVPKTTTPTKTEKKENPVTTIPMGVRIMEKNDNLVLGELYQSNSNNPPCYIIINVNDNVGEVVAQENSSFYITETWEDITKENK